jgi:hypothetical protein
MLTLLALEAGQANELTKLMITGTTSAMRNLGRLMLFSHLVIRLWRFFMPLFMQSVRCLRGDGLNRW